MALCASCSWRTEVKLAGLLRRGLVEEAHAAVSAGFPPAGLRALQPRTRAPRGAAGLGLALVDAIARAHGGRVVAANRAGGTGVTISLEAPLAPRAPAG